MSACSASDGNHLTTSRINRLLRPLRNKCLSLNKFLTAARQSASRRTSLPHNQNWSPESPPPLALLRQPPSATRGRLYLDKGFAEDLELARLVYAVCDAFRNLVQVTHGAIPGEPIPSLAAMCCFIVGDNVPFVTDNTHEGHEEVISEDELMKVVDGIYDAVPTYYRRHSIASHGLSLVLAICPHHHTLVSTLLDICLSFGLVYESHRLLNIILENAFLSTTPPPIMHPAHVSYLTDLLVKWISGSNDLALSRTTTSPLFSVPTFSRAVLGVLAWSEASLWSSKALSRFIRSLEATDMNSFLTALDFLVETVHHCQRTLKPGKGKEKTPDAIALRDHLRDLMNRVSIVTASASAALGDRSCSSSIDSIVTLLDRCRHFGLHTLRLNTPSQPFQDELPDAITALAAHIYATFPLPDYDSRLLNLLREVSPIPTTFSQLVEYMHRNSAQDFMTSLQQFSSTLQIHNLLQLDASLWACALRVFENAPKGISQEMERTKFLLIDAVDEAERRLFGAGPSDSSPAIRIPGQIKRSRGAHYRRPSGEWKWEPMVGSFIQKTPVHPPKKRKMAAQVDLHESPTFIRRLLRRGAERHASNSTTVSFKFKSPKSTTYAVPDSPYPLSLQGSEGCSKSNGDSGWSEEDEENIMWSSPIAERRPLKPRHSNFSSILADAQKNRENLHGNKSSPSSTVHVMKRGASSDIFKQSSSRLPLTRKQFAVDPPDVPLTSDDLMDLFAYATSSPRM